VKTHTLETAEAAIVYDVEGPLPTADGRPPLRQGSGGHNRSPLCNPYIHREAR
jgi:hypothetical protein